MLKGSLLLALIVLSVLPAGCSDLSIQISANPTNAPQPGNAPSTQTPISLSSTAPSVSPVAASTVPDAANAQAIAQTNTQPSISSTRTPLDAEVRKQWIDFYRFSESLPSSPSPMVKEYKIRIYEAGDLVLADIDIDGFQTMKRLQADVVPMNGNAEKIGLYFKTIREGNTLGSYKQADLLMTLQLVRNGAQTLRVTFAGLVHLFPNTEMDGKQSTGFGKISARDRLGNKRDMSVHVEAFYRWQITDNIGITPGVWVILNPENKSRNAG